MHQNFDWRSVLYCALLGILVGLLVGGIVARAVILSIARRNVL